MANGKNKPVDRTSAGRVTLLEWKNEKDGRTFPSYSLQLRRVKRDADDPKKFTGHDESLDLLTKYDINDLKTAIAIHESKKESVDDEKKEKKDKKEKKKEEAK